jgi:hypothetical protein
VAPKRAGLVDHVPNEVPTATENNDRATYPKHRSKDDWHFGPPLDVAIGNSIEERHVPKCRTHCPPQILKRNRLH